ncbi:SLC13 family permease [Natronosalvus vescus]|uniref:SLC13 family permease n=1 Tax=Natronosalvus vescus TaxID=2953881 RepID=UPI002090EF64|nr:SLC13 family permease [Natronosalvus vescus]
MNLVVLRQQTDEVPALSPEMLVVFAIIAIAIVLFVTQPIPLDITALLVVVALVVLEPWTTITAEEGVSGFSSPATITVLMMFVLSEGVRRTGAIQSLGEQLAAFAGTSPRRQLGSMIGVSGVSAGFINNTPVVALLIPVANDLAARTGTSPSRLLIPLSFASMMGGMLTLIGTSTNILASDIVARPEYLGRPFSMFEFTALGALVLVSGSIYLLFAAPLLLPERVEPTTELIDEFDMTAYLTEITVPEESPMTGKTILEVLTELDVDLDAVTLVRGADTFGGSIEEKTLQSNDVLLVRAGRDAILEVDRTPGLELLPQTSVSDTDLETRSTPGERSTPQILAEIVIAPDGTLAEETLATSNFRQRFDATVLAIRRGTAIVHTRMEQRPLRGGDSLLVRLSKDALERLNRDRNVIVAGEYTRPTYRRSKLPLALAIIAGVVGIAALEIFPILLTSIAGAVAMVGTGVLDPREIYGAVDWSVIFLLAGLIPLGIAMERTGAAAFLAGNAVMGVAGLHIVIVLGLFYLFTALMTELLSNNASVVLMIPIAFDAAARVGADPYAFVLAVTFAASTPLLTPVGYQTNLMVYGPGGYKFTDFARLGLPLQLILTVVTTLGIVFIWGV